MYGLHTLIDCCIIIHNMKIVERHDSYTFNDLRDDLAQEADNDSDEDVDVIESVFPENSNLNDDGIRYLFACQVGFMNESTEDSVKHVNLLNDLKFSIYHNY